MDSLVLREEQGSGVKMDRKDHRDRQDLKDRLDREERLDPLDYPDLRDKEVKMAFLVQPAQLDFLVFLVLGEILGQQVNLGPRDLQAHQDLLETLAFPETLVSKVRLDSLALLVHREFRVQEGFLGILEV